MPAVEGDSAVSPVATVWRARRSRGGLAGLAVAAILIFGGVALLFWATRQQVGSLPLFAQLLATTAIGAGAGLGIFALGYFRLRYEFAPGALLVHWAGPTETGPGYHVGTVRSRSLGTMRAFCTDRSVESLSVVVTASRTIVLSPSDPAAFRRDLIRRIEESVGQDEPVPAVITAASGLPSPLSTGLVCAAIALLIGSVLALLVSFASLPETLALPGWVVGAAPVSSPRAELYRLPAVGAAIMATNVLLAVALRRRDRAAPLVLLGSAVAAEALLLVATLRILP